MSLFETPTGALDGVKVFISDLVIDGWPFIALAIGIPLAFYVIQRFINLTPKGK